MECTLIVYATTPILDCLTEVLQATPGKSIINFGPLNQHSNNTDYASKIFFEYGSTTYVFEVTNQEEALAIVKTVESTYACETSLLLTT